MVQRIFLGLQEIGKKGPCGYGGAVVVLQSKTLQGSYMEVVF